MARIANHHVPPGNDHPRDGLPARDLPPLRWATSEQRASARWGGARASRRPAGSAERQRHGAGCVEGHHPAGAQRVHLLGRGGETGHDPPTSHSSDPGGARRRSAPSMLLAGLPPPGAQRQPGARHAACAVVNVTGRAAGSSVTALGTLPNGPAEDPSGLSRRQGRAVGFGPAGGVRKTGAIPRRPGRHRMLPRRAGRGRRCRRSPILVARTTG